MNDNEFSCIPFERAFKRLRVDGDELPNNSIKNKCSSDKLLRNNSNSLNESCSNNVPSCTATTNSSTMWRSIDKSTTFNRTYDKALKTSDQDKQSFDKLRLADKSSFDNASTDQRSTLDKTAFDRLTLDVSLDKTAFNHQFKSVDLKPESDNVESKCNSLLNDLKKTSVKSSSNTELAQNCSHQARNESDITVDELAGYLDLQLYLPKKMSFMAELAYS